MEEERGRQNGRMGGRKGEWVTAREGEEEGKGSETE